MTGQLVRSTPWPRQQFTAAIGALAVKYRIGASRAEGALERADACIGGVRWQVGVATFAIGSELKHGVPWQW